MSDFGINNDLNTISRRVSPGVERARKAQPDKETYTLKALEEEPMRFNEQDFRALLMSCVLSGATDITFQSDAQPRAEAHGVLYRATRRALAPSEVDMILTETYGGANGRAEVNAMRVLDHSYELNLTDGTRQRFRVNTTGILSGLEITFRALPRDTPTVEGVSLTMDEVHALAPLNGIVVIGGATGSGKSTTMAAVNRHHLETSPRPVKIVDIQAPIEYTYRDVTRMLQGSSSIIGQSEVGRHIRSFADGVHSALRRKPNIINVGEARDFETISASLEASLTGHLVYTTTHASSVSDAIRRLLTIFPGSERESRAYDLISALRFLMVQHLIPRADRVGRLPVREYLRFTPEIRDVLMATPVNDWPSLVTRLVSGRQEVAQREGMRSYLPDVVASAYTKGWISRGDAETYGGIEALALAEKA